MEEGEEEEVEEVDVSGSGGVTTAAGAVAETEVGNEEGKEG